LLESTFPEQKVEEVEETYGKEKAKDSVSKALLIYTNSYIIPSHHHRVNIIADYLLPIPL
jgi:hypothetical protein